MPIKEQEIKKYKVFYACDHCEIETKIVPKYIVPKNSTPNTVKKELFYPEIDGKVEYFCPNCKATFWLKELYPKIIEK